MNTRNPWAGQRECPLCGSAAWTMPYDPTNPDTGWRCITCREWISPPSDTAPTRDGAKKPARTRQPAPHTCHADSCEERVPRRMLMCRRHWYMVPPAIRDAVWATYVPGQERRVDPTPEYLEAARAAVEAVAVRERVG